MHFHLLRPANNKPIVVNMCVFIMCDNRFFPLVDNDKEREVDGNGAI